MLETLTKILRSYRLRFGNEQQLQDDIASVLAMTGFSYSREHRFNEKDRIDFFLDRDGIGIECKVEGSPSAVAQQCVRYADIDELHALILVSRRANHDLGVDAMRGKPFQFVWIAGGAL